MMKKNNYSQTNQEENQNLSPYDFDDSTTDLTFPKTRIRLGLIMTVFGFLVFILGARPSIFGLDRSRVIGFVQISVFLVGLAFIAFGSYLALHAFWPEGKKTIAADIGSRLISTGYVICVFTAMADIFGLGSHPLPDVFFGPLQARGMGIGMATIAVGFLLLIRFKRNGHHKSSSTQEDLDVEIEEDKKKPDESTLLDEKIEAVNQY